MTSLTGTITDKLLQDYNSILFRISFKLDEENRKNLLHYCNGLILKQVTYTIDILRSLEYNGKISWEDVKLVKEAMRKINRFDIERELTEYEIKRDLTLLLDFYARKIQAKPGFTLLFCICEKNSWTFSETYGVRARQS